jgi:hypothetical protein
MVLGQGPCRLRLTKRQTRRPRRRGTEPRGVPGDTSGSNARMRISAIGWPNGGDLAALDTVGAMYGWREHPVTKFSKFQAPVDFS